MILREKSALDESNCVHDGSMPRAASPAAGALRSASSLVVKELGAGTMWTHHVPVPFSSICVNFWDGEGKEPGGHQEGGRGRGRGVTN